MAQLFQVAAKALIFNQEKEILMVHIPEWIGNQAHWDLPGGRIDEGGDLLETLNRELLEELSVSYSNKPKQYQTFITNITIPEYDKRMPLMNVVYIVELEYDKKIKLDPESSEDDFGWFKPKDASKEMCYKFPEDFCDQIANF